MVALRGRRARSRLDVRGDADDRVLVQVLTDTGKIGARIIPESTSWSAPSRPPMWPAHSWKRLSAEYAGRKNGKPLM